MTDDEDKTPEDGTPALKAMVCQHEKECSEPGGSLHSMALLLERRWQTRFQRLEKRNRKLRIAVVALSMVLAGFFGWIVVHYLSTLGTNAP